MASAFGPDSAVIGNEENTTDTRTQLMENVAPLPQSNTGDIRGEEDTRSLPYMGSETATMRTVIPPQANDTYNYPDQAISSPMSDKVHDDVNGKAFSPSDDGESRPKDIFIPDLKNADCTAPGFSRDCENSTVSTPIEVTENPAPHSDFTEAKLIANDCDIVYNHAPTEEPKISQHDFVHRKVGNPEENGILFDSPGVFPYDTDTDLIDHTGKSTPELHDLPCIAPITEHIKKKDSVFAEANFREIMPIGSVAVDCSELNDLVKPNGKGYNLGEDALIRGAKIQSNGSEHEQPNLAPDECTFKEVRTVANICHLADGKLRRIFISPLDFESIQDSIEFDHPDNKYLADSLANICDGLKLIHDLEVRLLCKDQGRHDDSGGRAASFYDAVSSFFHEKNPFSTYTIDADMYIIATHKKLCYAVFVGRKGIRIKKFHTKRSNALAIESTTNTIMHRAFIMEEPTVKVMQPPQRLGGTSGNMQDERARASSFERRGSGRSLPLVPPSAAARAGFYLLHDDAVACFSCNKQWRVQSIIGTDLSDTHWHWPTCQYTFQRNDSSIAALRDVVSDGRISDIASDPPGQQSVYIPPGDVQKEIYRLSTFENFPSTCPVERRTLAKSGFYYTGFFDRVKCFCCGRAVEQWDARDNPADLIWHKHECQLAHNRPSGNVPINDLFNRLNTNSTTRQQQPTQQQQNMSRESGNIVRYPQDLPERVRNSGGMFQISPGNTVVIQNGPAPRPNPPRHVGNMSAPPAPLPGRWRMANVVSADTRRFLMNLYLNRELDRLTSFARWPMSRPNVSPVALAKSGFFYLGDMDRTQCFSCGGVLRNWTLEDDAEEEHRTHFPNCHMVLGFEQRNITIPTRPELPDELAQNFPCRYAASPHMGRETARRETFDHRWQTGRVGATPAAIAEAGFFFLGERDRVKCWYCNGGLQNWEYDDIPWVEHAKWFPNCQFLLQNQGQAFVYRHLSLNPHLARPIIAKQDGSPIDPVTNAGPVVRARDIPPPSGPIGRQPSPPPAIIDPREEMRKKEEKVNRVLETSDAVKNVVAMGFAKETVRRVLEEKVDSVPNSAEIYTSVSALLDDVMKKDEELQREAEEERQQRQANANLSSLPSTYSTGLSSATSSIGTNPSVPFGVSSFDDDDDEGMDLYSSIESTAVPISANKESAATNVKMPEDKKSLQEMLTKIEEERMCKICFSNTADMVFIPCSHMCCCLECTQAIRQCPVCRKKIEKAIKTYAS